LEEGETAFNDLLIFPFLKAVAKAIAEENEGSSAEFKVGEVSLIAMMKQLEEQDESILYKTGGIIKLYSLEKLEVLLLETPSCCIMVKVIKKKVETKIKKQFGYFLRLIFISV
jgi:hypothetical protein